MAKREREQAKANKRKDKLARREQRKALKAQGESGAVNQPGAESEEASGDDQGSP